MCNIYDVPDPVPAPPPVVASSLSADEQRKRFQGVPRVPVVEREQVEREQEEGEFTPSAEVPRQLAEGVLERTSYCFADMWFLSAGVFVWWLVKVFFYVCYVCEFVRH